MMFTIYASVCGPYQLHVFYSVCLTRGIDVSAVKLICRADGQAGLTAEVCRYAEEVLGFVDPIDFVQSSVYEEFIQCGLTCRKEMKLKIKDAILGSRTDTIMEYWHSLGDETLEACIKSSLMPARVCFYEDGFGSSMKVQRLSYLNAFKAAIRTCLKLDFKKSFAHVQWALQVGRRLRASEYWVVDAELWKKLGRGITHGVKVSGISSQALTESFKKSQVIEVIRNEAVLLTNVYSERSYCDLDHELGIYRSILQCFQSCGIGCSIKMHPRTSVEKANYLHALCSQYGGQILDASINPLESYLSLDNNCARILVGPPTTALLNAEHLNLGKAICLGDGIFTSTDHIGESARRIFEAAGISVPCDLAALNAILGQYGVEN
tara:strand:- start:3450 stop:4586 length:1137 start_codon:yes stop_codon:yes gene_type:complete